MKDGKVEENEAIGSTLSMDSGFIANTNELLVDQAGALIEKVRRYLVRLLVFPLDEDSQPPLVCLFLFFLIKVCSFRWILELERTRKGEDGRGIFS